MAGGSGLSGLLPIAMLLVGIVTMLRRRSQRRTGRPMTDEDLARRQGEAAEMERRMTSYLAGRETGHGYAAGNDEQENGR